MINDVIIGIKRNHLFCKMYQSRLAKFDEIIILEIDDKAIQCFW